MAKVKEQSPLDTAVGTREQIIERRVKGQHARLVMENGKSIGPSDRVFLSN